MRKSKRQKIKASVISTDYDTRLRSLSHESPSISVQRQSGSPEINICSANLLEQLIHPISKQTFLEFGFRKKALHITGQGESLIQSILEELHQVDPKYLFQETSSENVFLWLRQTDGKIQSLEIQDPQQAWMLHQLGGHATYCRAPPNVEQPMVANLLRGTGLGCGQYDPSGESVTSWGRGEVEVFIGTTSHSTPWHYDFQENFTLQLTGRKTWRLQQGTTPYPRRACTPHYASPEIVESQLKVVKEPFQFGNPQVGINAMGDIHEVTLNPGDVLYFPAGMWHYVTTDEPGVSINVSLMATNYASIACQALQHILMQRAEWQETIHDSSHRPVLDTLQTLLQTLPNIVQDFVSTFGAAAIAPPILRYPPLLQIASEEEDGSFHDKSDSDSENLENKNDENLKVLGTNVIDVSSFDPPNEWKCDSPGPNKSLALNPLGWVRPLQDVVHHYDPGKNYPNLYVININFAGNDMHESAVRLVVHDETNPKDICHNTFGAREKCYLFHGYYCWAQKDD
jgi:Cupin superfamily protein